MQKSIRLIVGLGNPGAEHEKTRHNAGFWFVDQLANAEHISLKNEKKFLGEFAQFIPEGQSQQIYVFKPMTYMNNSGNAVRSVMNFYKLTPDEMLVVHDELDLPPGDVKLKFGGGHAGHNGLRDIISHLHTNQFYRLRYGIGHPGDKDQVHDYVLTQPSRSDKQQMEKAIDNSMVVIPDLVAGEIDRATRKLHASN